MSTPSLDTLLAQLYEMAPQLTATRLSLLNQMAVALQAEFEGSPNKDSDFATPAFYEYFASRLLIHHAVVEEKLNKKSFEYIFRDALRHDENTAHLTLSSVHPGADLILNGERFSLKTEASRSLRAAKITISKFMEARWIRDKDELGLARDSSRKLSDHLESYDRIVMLRAAYLAPGQVKYDLVEIPHDLLMLATRIEAKDITLSKGRSGGGSAVVRQDEEAVLTLKFDGSVEKVTIANLLVERCTIHATWQIPLTITRFERSQEGYGQEL
ncbi:MAG: hypothetical protein DCF25_09385 [Leptolyngbya foveolarum]|uniref:Restriction endonuclease n=1 Tax=Leptolyngbya foveolarum TaxID=47253 RepID=A0A2W4UBR7_9CYAN|nr:MAG: hypothetical protein DCF25_09385 [Leptolyngbya foveolarum]